MSDEPGTSQPRPMSGVSLQQWVPGSSTLVRGVSQDSRRIELGDLYVALPGANRHGASFASAAVAAGASAVLTDAAGAALAADCGVPVVVVDDPRAVMAQIASEVHGDPSSRLLMAGVTGTNGKTSTVFLLQAALRALGRSVATVGTLGLRLNDEVVPMATSTITTPESDVVQSFLAEALLRGADSAAVEVSSHALSQHRVDAITFDVAGFSMLGQDHLEYHKTVENYFEAKSRLFLGGRSRRAIVNVDDPWGRRLAELVTLDGHAQLVTTSVDGAADYRVTAVERHADGAADVSVAHPGGNVDFRITMLGDFNVQNALTALAMVGAAGLDVAKAASGLEHAQVPGRMQRIELGAGAPHVVVDFAHTPQAVEAAMSALPDIGRRIAVLGAGGDRDDTKRGPMGAAAARNADIVIVTDDNPRSEVPRDIREQILAGARQVANKAEIIDGGDRRSAIQLALRRGRPGDWIAILGKGHETGQEIAGEVHPFDDVAVVLQLWRESV